MTQAESPLLRSGLALSGANTWLRGCDLPIDAGNGLLTAYDVTGMDLLDTRLVVLSACVTGLGQIRVGEGVFGLRRAFVEAGAAQVYVDAERAVAAVPSPPRTAFNVFRIERFMHGGAKRWDRLPECRSSVRVPRSPMHLLEARRHAPGRC